MYYNLYLYIFTWNVIYLSSIFFGHYVMREVGIVYLFLYYFYKTILQPFNVISSCSRKFHIFIHPKNLRQFFLNRKKDILQKLKLKVCEKKIYTPVIGKKSSEITIVQDLFELYIVKVPQKILFYYTKVQYLFQLSKRFVLQY